MKNIIKYIVIIPIFFCFSGCSKGFSISKGHCVDVTTYDYNRNNDMKCKRQDGSIFYTDYAGARDFESN